MIEHSLYAGATPQLAAPSPQLAANAAAGDHGQLLGQAVGVVASTLEATANKFAQVNDAGAYNRQQADEREIASRLQRRMINDPYAFLREDGMVDERAIDETIDEYRRELEEKAPKYMLPGSRESAIRARENMIGNLKLSLQGQVLQNKIKLARENYAANLDSSIALHDFDAARSIVDANTGVLISPEQARNAHLKISIEEGNAHEQDMIDRARVLVADDPDKLAEAIENGDFDDVQASTDIALRGMLAQAYRPSRLATRKGKNGKDEVYEEAPRGLPDYMVKAWVPKKTREAMNPADWVDHVRPAATRWAMAQVTRPDDPAELDRVKTVFKEYGLSDKLATDIVEQRRKELNGSADFNCSAFFNSFFAPEAYLDDKERSEYLDHKRRIAELKQKAAEDLKMPTEHPDFKGKGHKGKDVYTYADEVRTREEKVRIAEEKAKRIKDQIKAETDVRFLAWRENKPKASPREQAGQYISFMEQAALRKYSFDKAPVVSAMKGATKKLEDSVQKKIDKAEEENNIDSENSRQTDAERKKKRFEVPLDMPINRDYKASAGLPGNGNEAVIYAPKGSNLGNSIILTTSDHAEEVKIIERDDVESVTLSRYLRSQFNMLHNPFYTIRFFGDRASLLAEPMRRYDSLIATPENEPMGADGQYEIAEPIASADGTVDDGLLPL